jgi:hypothetical protein
VHCFYEGERAIEVDQGESRLSAAVTEEVEGLRKRLKLVQCFMHRLACRRKGVHGNLGEKGTVWTLIRTGQNHQGGCGQGYDMNCKEDLLERRNWRWCLL